MIRGTLIVTRPAKPVDPTNGGHMPHSDGQGKDVALDWYRMISPKTVVDVGAGAGTYAKLMRPEPTWKLVPTDIGWPMRKYEWSDGARWTGIEAWGPYWHEFRLYSLYDRFITGDVRHMPAADLDADLVIFGDVLEHMATAEARTVLAEAKQAAANIIVSIPVLHLDQDAVNGNPFERHIDHWTYEAMRAELSDGLVKTWCGDVLAYYWWRRQ